ncbi:MAG: DUF3551 domain-containing protein [Pseudolabrys sp.]
MHRALFAAAVLSVALIAGRPAQAEMPEPPWCGVLSLGPGNAYWDCRYRSFEECYPNILSGNRGFCIQNPRYDWSSVPAKKPRRAARRR